MEKYLSGGKLSPDEIRVGIRQRVIANEVVPVLCGTAFKNKGVQALLDAVVYYLPSPADLPPVRGQNGSEQEVLCTADDNEELTGLIFKVATDPYVGQLSFFRVYSGTLNSGTTVLNASRNKKNASGVFCRCMPTAVKTSKKCAPATLPPP